MPIHRHSCLLSFYFRPAWQLANLPHPNRLIATEVSSVTMPNNHPNSNDEGAEQNPDQGVIAPFIREQLELQQQQFDQQRQQLDHLSTRMDRMTDMFTQLMAALAVNMALPNIPPSYRNASAEGRGGDSQDATQEANNVSPPTVPSAGPGFNSAAGSIPLLVRHPPPPSHQQQQGLPPTRHVRPSRNMSTNGGNQAIPTPAVQNVNQNAPTPPMQNNVTAQNIPLLSTQNSSNNQTTQIFPPLPTLPQSNTQQAADRNRYTAAYDSDTGASQRSSRSFTHRRAEARRHRRPPSTDDETGEYAYNQQRPKTNSCREIKILASRAARIISRALAYS